MKNKVSRLIFSLKYPIGLTLLILFVFLKNYSKGTWYTGFDNLHPEFDFTLAFFRSINVWQEHMGLGLNGGMSYASDLGRTLILYLLSFIFPLSMLRYLWFFLMLLMGVLGIYFFIISILSSDLESQEDVQALAFAGSLFYFYNLSTIQLFYSGFDGFVALYGFLPWLFLVSVTLLNRFSKRLFILYVLLLFFSASIAYTGTLYISFSVFYSIYMLIMLSLKFSLIRCKRFIFMFFTFACMNLFWALPVYYFIRTEGQLVPQSTISLLSSEESLSGNRNFGNLSDILFLKGYWFDNRVYDVKTEKFDSLLTIWPSYLTGLPIRILMTCIAFVLILGGLVASVHKKHFGFPLLAVIGALFVSNNLLVVKIISKLGTVIPLFSEAFRTPFTKVSVFLSFVFSILFVLGLQAIALLVRRHLAREVSFKYIALTSLLIFSFVYRPYFTGNLFNPRMRVDVPSYYFEFFKYMKSQDAGGKIYLLPNTSFWAWDYYRWGYQGSGFLWYGVKQPIFARAYDVWNSSNENVYWQINTAFNLDNPDILGSVIDQYRIKWFVLDSAVISVVDDQQVLDTKLIQQLDMLYRTKKVLASKEFGSIKLIELSTSPKILYTKSNVPRVAISSEKATLDPAYFIYKDYISSNTLSTYDIAFPYSYLFNVRNISNDLIHTQSLSNNTSELTFASLYQPAPYKDYHPGVGININSSFSIYKKPGVDPAATVVLKALFPNPSSYEFILDSKDGFLIIPDDYTMAVDDLNEIEKSQMITIPTNKPIITFNKKDASKIPLNVALDSKVFFDTCSKYDFGSYSYEATANSLMLSSHGQDKVCVFSRLQSGLFPRGSVVGIKLGITSFGGSSTLCLLNNKTQKCEFFDSLPNVGVYSRFFYLESESSEYYLYYYASKSRDLPFQNTFSVTYTNTEIMLVPAEKTKHLYLNDLTLASIPAPVAPIFILQGGSVDNSTHAADSVVPLYPNTCQTDPTKKIPLNRFDGDFVFKATKSSPYCFDLLTGFRGSDYKGKYGYLLGINYLITPTNLGQSICNEGKFSCANLDKIPLMPTYSWKYYAAASSYSNHFVFNLTPPTASEVTLYLKEARWLPFNLLGVASYNLVDDKIVNSLTPTSELVEYIKLGTWYYSLENVSPNSGVLLFNQGFNPGWVAFCGTSPCTESIEEINNWGMGLTLANVESLTLIYLPQLLLFIGYLMMFVPLIMLKYFKDPIG